MTPATGTEKVVLILARLPAEAAGRVLAHLDPRHREEIQARLAAAPPGADADLARLLDELEPRLEQARLVSLLTPQAPASDPAPATAPRLAEGTGAARPAPDVEVPPLDGEDPLEALSTLHPAQLAAALGAELPATAAMVLNAMDADLAGEVLKRLPPEMRRDATLRLSRLESTPAELLRRVARAVLAKAVTAGEGNDNSGDAKPRQLAAVLRAVDRRERGDILAAMQDSTPELAAKVVELLYQFDDLQRIEDRSLQKLLSEIDAKTLAVALKGADDAIITKIRNNLSRRAQENLTEEMELLGVLSIVQVRECQKSIIEVIQRLDQAGELVMLD